MKLFLKSILAILLCFAFTGLEASSDSETSKNMYFTPQAIDNGIFEAIRTKLVENEHLPDITTFAEAGNFENAQKSLGENLIKLFPVGHRYERGELENNVIIIDRRAETPGDLGFNGKDDEFDEAEQTFVERDFPKRSLHVEYRITCISKSQKTMDKQMLMCRQAFDSGRIMGYHEDETEAGNFELEITNYFNVSDANFLEQGFDFQVRNVFLHRNAETGRVNPLISNAPTPVMTK